MRKQKIVFLALSILLILCLANCGGNSMFWFATYDHIQHNGIDYYQTEDQQHPFDNQSDKELLVYLVDSSSKVDYKNPRYASGYEERIYLFFDGAVYIRGDHRNSLTEDK